MENKIETFAAFCERFWHDNLSGSETTISYRYDKVKCVRHYIAPYFKDEITKDITPAQIKEFIMHLSTVETDRSQKARKHGVLYTKNRYLAAGSIRIIRTAVGAPIKFAAENGMNKQEGDWNESCKMVRKKSCAGYFKGMVSPRDIFTSEELDALVHSQWEDERAYMMFLLARYTGMRNGELRGLRMNAIKPDHIDIQKSYNSIDGLKCTKNGTARCFPIYKGLYERLQEYIKTLPIKRTKNGDEFVFPSFVKHGEPVGAGFASTALNAQMKKLNIPKERVEGGVIVTRTFHSLRHCMDTWLTNYTKLGLASVARLMGHSQNMVQHYSDHFNNELYSIAASQIASSSLWPEQYRKAETNASDRSRERLMRILLCLQSKIDLLLKEHGISEAAPYAMTD